MGSSKKQTVGYRYYMGLHFGLCHGPVDAVTEVRAGDRTAWEGNATNNQTLSINAPELFGGDKKEGGLQGSLDVLMGAPSQGLNGYLQSRIGAVIPAFRGIVSAVWNGGLIAANNPYVKPWSFRVKRILQGWSTGAAWNPDTAEPLSYGEGGGISASYVEDFSTFPAGYTFGTGGEPFFSTMSTPYGTGLVVTNVTSSSGNAFTRRAIPSAQYTSVRLKTAVLRNDPGDAGADADLMTVTVGEVIDLQVSRDATGTGSLERAQINGTFIGATPMEVGQYYQWEFVIDWTSNTFDYVVTKISTGAVFASGTLSLLSSTPIARLAYGTDVSGGERLNDSAVVTDIRLQAVAGQLIGAMNPAHIVYECLTNTAWGMGYPTTSIDDAAFTAAADALYSEGFGLCMVWNRQDTLESFIKVVLDHAGGILYVDPTSGKFALKLIRDDYDPEELPLFGPSNLIAATDFQRQAWGETVNELTVVYRDLTTNKDSAVTLQDLANIQTQGAVVSQTRQYPGIPTAGLAQRVALRDLNSVSTPLARVRLTATRAAWNIIPGGVFRLTWPDFGIDEAVFRVLEVNRGTLQNGTITIEAVEDVFGLPENTYTGNQAGGWVEPSNEPEPAPFRKLIEAPYWDLARSLTAADLDYLDDLSGYLQTLAVRPSGDALNYEVNARVGVADFEERTIGEFCPTAQLTAAIGKTTTAITFDAAVDVDLVAVGGYAIIDDEVVGITAIDVDAGTATITRGLLDTVPADHANDARIWFADGFQGVDETEYASGEAVDVKLLPRTGLGELALAAAPTDSITMAQRHNRPYPPGLFRIAGQAYPIELVDVPLAASWAHRDRLSQTAYLVQQSEGNIGPEAGVTYTVRLYDDDAGLLLDNQTGISGTAWTGPTLFGVFQLRIEVEAVRAGLASWQPQRHVFTYINGARLTEDGGDNRITEAGEIRSQE